MGWIKIDDGFADHLKYIEAGPLAGYLCLASIAWCNRNRTDGFIPKTKVKQLLDLDGFTETPEFLADRLVTVGLWEAEKKGYRVHDYHDWQRTKDEIERLTEQRQEAGRLGGQARALASVKQTPSNSLASRQALASSKTQAEEEVEEELEKEEETSNAVDLAALLKLKRV